MRVFVGDRLVLEDRVSLGAGGSRELKIDIPGSLVSGSYFNVRVFVGKKCFEKRFGIREPRLKCSLEVLGYPKALDVGEREDMLGLRFLYLGILILAWLVGMSCVVGRGFLYPRSLLVVKLLLRFL
ncbi:MAG: hypothetical protein DRN68_08510 [Thaumarchaeota archaeon]|mgnify:CR=1 FL=1|nr:MAG: hypothetical protein DRN68_08510 [Nitrososphaerota archaeon]